MVPTNIRRKKTANLRAILVTAVLMFASTGFAQETVLHTFNDTDGNEPIGSLMSDAKGNLFGTTFYGGTNEVGTVYELKRTAKGNWTEKVLHSFNVDGVDGYFTTASLVMDSTGNLYGTTFLGGTADAGTVFELSPAAGGTWTEKVLHSFLNGASDGAFPRGALILDAAGNLYGTTTNGGPSNDGLVYQLTPNADGTWSENVLYAFSGPDGAAPFGPLLFDSAGNLYGTTSGGGGTSGRCKFGCGIVFELSKNSDGTWSENILHNFNVIRGDGMFPYGALSFDASGNLFGTTNGGGAGNYGTVFELLHSTGPWKEKLLHAFNGSGDGIYPTPGLVFDAAGNLYGATQSGGSSNSGAVYKLTPTTSGPWQENLLYSFDPSGSGGYDPAQSPIIDAAGNIYGTVISGGTFGGGTAYEIVP